MFCVCKDCCCSATCLIFRTVNPFRAVIKSLPNGTMIEITYKLLTINLQSFICWVVRAGPNNSTPYANTITKNVKGCFTRHCAFIKIESSSSLNYWNASRKTTSLAKGTFVTYVSKRNFTNNIIG